MTSIARIQKSFRTPPFYDAQGMLFQRGELKSNEKIPSSILPPLEKGDREGFELFHGFGGTQGGFRSLGKIMLAARTAFKTAARVCMALGLASVVACQQKMADQPRYKPLARSEFFGDERSARPLIEGTVARGDLRADEHFYTGKVNGKLVDAFPFPITREILLRGQERFNIYCSPCHDRTGTGQGMIVKRGYRAPPSYHTERLRTAPVGHFFEVIISGFGLMPDYAQQVPPADRWAIIAYIRALQLSQNAKLSDVPEAARRTLETTR